MIFIARIFLQLIRSVYIIQKLYFFIMGCISVCNHYEKSNLGIPEDYQTYQQYRNATNKINKSKIIQKWNWGNDIVVNFIQNCIRVDLPPPYKFKHFDYNNIRQCHFYIYERKMDSEQPEEDLTTCKFIDRGFSLQFKPTKNIKKQEYDYIFAFQMKNYDIINVKCGTIIMYGDVGPQSQLKFIKNDSNKIQISLNKKVDQIKQNGHIINILILGKKGLGKSSFIRNCLIILNQLYEFQSVKLPKTGELDNTFTKQFESYSLTYTNKQNENKCQINLVDGPGLGDKLKDISSNNFNDIYCDALKLLLNGELNYGKFCLPDHINVQVAKQNQDPNKIIHYCLIFIRPQDVNQLKQMILRLTTLITQSQITYGLVINRSDEYLGNDLPSYQLTKKIKDRIRQEGYRVQGFNHIFSTCLSPIYFPQNQIFYEQFQKSIYYSLSSAIQQISNNIFNIYLQQNNTQKFLRMLKIRNNKTLQQFIRENIQLKQKDINDIEIKYKSKDQYLNVGKIISEEDPEDQSQKNLLYYKTKVNNRWKIVFRIKDKSQKIL